ncbi:MAG: serine/threonine protein kinase [Gammaproteobacteria bacterium]|nr:serine/threonine protein kinase [Gammaproteobacteria bacterium]MDH5308779.1 serine/threonine protein kinase [Gammaproteobacteria bacterium]
MKKDLFGEVRLEPRDDGPVIVRDARSAPASTRWLARRLLAREARALAALAGLPGVPELLRAGRDILERSYVEGQPLHRAKAAEPAFYAAAQALLRRIHARDVAHNDLAKEPNLLVGADGSPAIIDFQLAWHAPARGWWFRLLAREDLRHLLKHKRSYCSEHLSRRERDILARPAVPSRLWMRTGKPVYLFVTRRLLGWADREGASDRGARQP